MRHFITTLAVLSALHVARLRQVHASPVRGQSNATTPLPDKLVLPELSPDDRSDVAIGPGGAPADACGTPPIVTFKPHLTFAAAIKSGIALMDNNGKAGCLYPDQARQYFVNAWDLATNIGDKSQAETLVAATYQMGHYFKAALEVYDRALALPGISADDEEYTLTELASCYREMRDYGTAISTYQRILALPGRTADEQVFCYRSIGDIYVIFEHEPLHARREYSKILDIQPDPSPQHHKAEAYFDIGFSYCGDGNYARARDYFVQVLKMPWADARTKRGAHFQLDWCQSQLGKRTAVATACQAVYEAARDMTRWLR